MKLELTHANKKEIEKEKSININERLDLLEAKLDDIYNILDEINKNPHMTHGVNYDMVTEIAMYNYWMFMMLDMMLMRGEFKSTLPTIQD